MSKHFTYIDWLKCIAITMVIMRHCSWFNDCITASIASVCCPLFFIVNGGLVLQKDYDFSTILRRNIHLLFIVVFWGVISTIICMYNRCEPISAKMVISRVCSLDLGYCNHLWFVCTLIVLNFLQPFLREFVKTHGTKDILALWIVVGLVSMQGFNNFLRPISIMDNWNGYNLFYYIGGYLLMTDKLKIKQLPTWGIIISIVFGYMLLLLHNWLLVTNEWWYSHFLHNDMHFDSFSTIPCALLTFSVFELFSRIQFKEIKIITHIAKYTFAIYLIHWVLLIPAKHFIENIVILPFILLPASLLIAIALDYIPYTRKLIHNK